MWDFRPFDPATFRAPVRHVTRVFLHCTDSDAVFLVGTRLAREVDSWHKANGWTGIGYSFVVDKAGEIVTGRPLELQPAAQLGPDGQGNVAAIAISVHGSKDFTPASLAATHALLVAIDAAYLATGAPVTFHGHCEIDPRPCPVYPYRQVHSLDERGRLKSVGARTAVLVPPSPGDWPHLPIAEPPAAPGGTRDLFEGCHGPDVEALQRKLGIAPADGWFGRMTLGAVIDWQQSHGLEADGVAGPATKRALGLR